VARWLARFGREATLGILEAQNLPAPICMQPIGRDMTADRLRAALHEEGVECATSEAAPGMLRVVSGHPWRTQAFARGDFYIQDEASALVSRLVAARPGDRVLDICAAPGGKSFEAASRVGPEGLVIAADLHPARAAVIMQNARRLELDRVAVLAADFIAERAPLPPDARFDRVVLDAPCTGTGVIRRHPEIRHRVSAASLAGLVAAQRRLLESAVARVKRGGRLIYSVCSLEPEEGEQQIAWLMHRHPGLTAEEPPLRTIPAPSGMDGFFAARLQRAGA
jgi:16S rRNA (cytosine967-C5)-methyltransferase